MTIQEFAPIALQVFRAAKGQNVGVSGETKMYRLYNTGHGSGEPIHSGWSDREFLWGLHDLLANVIECFVQTSQTDDRFEKVLDEFTGKAREVRSGFVGDTNSREFISAIRSNLETTRADSSPRRPSQD